jgi:meso-butanediol dehydrogenase / (S,S)-butanediol dehydrogenase / diacetyl reductase
MSQGRIAGKVAVVTGGGSGIGRASALRFAAEGAKVVVNDLNGDAAGVVAKEIEAAGGVGVAFPADVSDSAQVDALIQEAVSRYGRLDVLMNCAFFMTIGTLDGLTDEEWRSNFSVTLDGTFYAIRAALVPMRAQRSGSIINVSSGAGVRSEITLAPYSAAKRAVLSLTETAAIENAEYGIRINAICPGPIATPPLLAFVDQMPGNEGSLDRYYKQIPFGRLGKPEEMAAVALFLASDEASYVSGANFVADCGIAAKSASPKFE